MPSDPAKRIHHFKAVIFDLDGTLLNTLNDIANAMNQVLVSRGFPLHPIDMYQYFIGNGLQKLIERALPKQVSSPDTVAACLEAFRIAYSKNWQATTRPYPGVPELLTRLTQQGIRMAILSNKAHAFTTQMVASLLAQWKFRPVFGARDQFPKKPDPTVVRHILKELHLSGSECILVGDSGVDMQTAAAAGLFSVGATWGFRSEAELLENGCQLPARHPLDILNLF